MTSSSLRTPTMPKSKRESKRYMMSPEEKLDLSPWAKYRLYGKFPFKLLLHVILTVLTTYHSITVSSVFDSYSRSISRSWNPLLFPNSYDSSAEESNWGKGYEIYTVNDTLHNAQYLVDQYYLMPSSSVDELAVYSPIFPPPPIDPDSEFLTVPQLIIKRSPDDGDDADFDDPFKQATRSFEIFNSTSGWPLSADSVLQNASLYPVDSMYLSDFFENLISLEFSMMVKTDGYVSGTFMTRYELCVYWRVSVLYEKGARGQIKVTLTDTPIGRCDDRPINDQLTTLSVFIAIFAMLYQALLLKACKESIDILKLIFKKQSILNEKTLNADAGINNSIYSNTNTTTQTPKTLTPVIGAINNINSWLRNGMGGDNNYNKSSAESTPATTPPASTLASPEQSQLQLLQSATEPLLLGEKNRAKMKAKLLKNAKNRAQAKRAENAWNSLGFKDKYFYIFNLWFVCATVACMCSFVYSIQILVMNHDFFTSETLKLLLGVAIACYWFSLVQYLEHFPRFYLLIYTLKTGIPRVMQFFFGILPFFVGYALLGMTLFGNDQELFGTFTDTCCTLFAVVNGDSILDVFDSLKFCWPLGDFYLYFYIMVFMYVVLMSVIAIVEESFFDSLRIQGVENQIHVEDEGDLQHEPGDSKSSSVIGTPPTASSTSAATSNNNSNNNSNSNSNSNNETDANLNRENPFERRHSAFSVLKNSLSLGLKQDTNEEQHDSPGGGGSVGNSDLVGSFKSPGSLGARALPPKLREVLRNVKNDDSSSSSEDEEEEEEVREEEGGYDSELDEVFDLND